jgi:hypothetical protein
MSTPNKRLNKRENPLSLNVKPQKEDTQKKSESIEFDLLQGTKSFQLFLLLSKELLEALKQIYPNDKASDLLNKVMLENLKTHHPKTYARLVAAQKAKGE